MKIQPFGQFSYLTKQQITRRKNHQPICRKDQKNKTDSRIGNAGRDQENKIEETGSQPSDNPNEIRRRAGQEETLRPSTERRPLRMHSFSPVPRTITSYSSSMARTGYRGRARAGDLSARDWRGEKRGEGRRQEYENTGKMTSSRRKSTRRGLDFYIFNKNNFS